MNKNNFLRILSLSMLLLPLNTYVSEPENVEPEKSYWQMYAPEFIQEAATSTSEYISSWIPQSVKDRINSWSTRKKFAIAGAILASLAAIYNRDILMAFVNDAIEKQRQEKFKSDVEFGVTGMKEAFDLTKLRQTIHDEKEPLLTPEDHKQIYKNFLMGKYPKEEADRIYEAVVNRLKEEGIIEE